MAMIPMYNTKTFSQVYSTAASFLADYKASALYVSTITDANITYIYYLLYARYGNSPIANFDETQFKYKMWSIIFQVAPTWQQELNIQTKLRNLTLTDSTIYQGTKMIYNHAYNPSVISSGEIPTLDDQNVTNYTKGALEGLNMLDQLLKTDISETLINRFRKLFKQFVRPNAIIYVTEEED